MWGAQAPRETFGELLRHHHLPSHQGQLGVKTSSHLKEKLCSFTGVPVPGASVARARPRLRASGGLPRGGGGSDVRRDPLVQRPWGIRDGVRNRGWQSKEGSGNMLTTAKIKPQRGTIKTKAILPEHSRNTTAQEADMGTSFDLASSLRGDAPGSEAVAPRWSEQGC